tara:strand:- start:8677 stop:10761 length:2085 start_codon:yes stop_codon:yes gene_type:complete
MFVNTKEFSRNALYYSKYGKYPDGDFGTDEWLEYWLEEKRRSIEGYSIAGVRISGYHYFYLNYSPIEKVIDKIVNGRAIKDREVGFPRFWDEDYNFFHVVDIARAGIELDDYKKLNLDINIKPEHLIGGKHVLYLKPRGVGASYKGGSMCARNYHLLRNTNSVCLANDKEYLDKSGILTKFQLVNSFLNGIGYNSEDKMGTSGFYVGQLSTDKAKMETICGMKFPNGSVDPDSKLNSVMGITLNNDYQKARGKRAYLINFEEFGKAPNADKAWEIALPSVQEGADVFGQIIGFGTGGTDGVDFAAMEKMFYNPDFYNIIGIENIWDEGTANTYVGHFTPAYKDIGFIDANGNSLQDKARSHYDKEFALAAKAPDGTLLPRKKAEKPYCPRDAMLNVGNNPFLSEELIRHCAEVKESIKNNTVGYGIPVELTADWYIYNDKLKSINNYPLIIDKNTKGVDTKGAVVIYSAPFKTKDNRVPDNLYIACNDPYAHDKALAKEDMSLGATYIIEQVNNLTQSKGGHIVASYIARPDTMDDYNRNLFRLATMYNAKIGYENNTGDVAGYAKRSPHLLDRLERQFTLEGIEGVGKSSVNRPFGMHMSPQRKPVGIMFLKDWLYEIRSEDTITGKTLLNLHLIKDVGLLEELIKFNDIGNFDRISAMLIGMFQLKELQYQRRIPTTKTSSFSKFLSIRKWQ